MRTINIKIVPDDVHMDAKVAATKEGKSLQDWVIEAIKEKLERTKQ